MLSLFSFLYDNCGEPDFFPSYYAGAYLKRDFIVFFNLRQHWKVLIIHVMSKFDTSYLWQGSINNCYFLWELSTSGLNSIVLSWRETLVYRICSLRETLVYRICKLFCWVLSIVNQVPRLWIFKCEFYSQIYQRTLKGQQHTWVLQPLRRL